MTRNGWITALTPSLLCLFVGCSAQVSAPGSGNDKSDGFTVPLQGVVVDTMQGDEITETPGCIYYVRSDDGALHGLFNEDIDYCVDEGPDMARELIGHTVNFFAVELIDPSADSDLYKWFADEVDPTRIRAEDVTDFYTFWSGILFAHRWRHHRRPVWRTDRRRRVAVSTTYSPPVMAESLASTTRTRTSVPTKAPDMIEQTIGQKVEFAKVTQITDTDMLRLLSDELNPEPDQVRGCRWLLHVYFRLLRPRVMR